MFASLGRRWWRGAFSLCVASVAGSALAASPTVEDALKLVPVQKEVEFDTPTVSDVAKCTIAFEAPKAWVVRNPSGQILRRFIDTNADGVVDLWCYYQDGIEVYRDIDENFNGSPDQYRWLNTAGIRWGIDTNEDRKIDAWKIISAEEVSAEAVQAIVGKDAAAFARLLITPEELATLGLGKTHADSLADAVKNAPDGFAKFVASQKQIGFVSAQKDVSSVTKWVDFGGTRPGLVPQGTDGSTKDVIVYENVVAMVQTGDKHDQIALGTMVQVGGAWRLIDAPETPEQLAKAAGRFFNPTPRDPAAPQPSASGPGPDQTVLLEQLQKIDEALNKAATPAEKGKLNEERADLVEKIAAGAGDNRAMWIGQMADTIGVAAQTGDFPNGVARLRDLHKKLAANPADDDLTAHVEFCILSAEYNLAINDAKSDFPKLQVAWRDSLAKFVKDHPKCPDAGEALLQLGISEEFAGQEQAAKTWYTQAASEFASTAAGKKSAGAVTRLDCVGKAISFKATSLSGASVDLASYRGKFVALHYWASWSQPCQNDLVQLRAAQAKYGDNLQIIGVALDNSKQNLVDFLKSAKLPWPQIYGEGGMDGDVATSMGIMTVPTMLLIDRQGKVVNRSLNAFELDKELGALIRPSGK